MVLPFSDYTADGFIAIKLAWLPPCTPSGMTYEHLKVYVEAASPDTEWAMEAPSLSYNEWRHLTRYAQATVNRDYDAVDEKLTEVENVRKAMGQECRPPRPSDTEGIISDRVFRYFRWAEGKAEILRCGRISKNLRAEFEKAEAKLETAWNELKGRGLSAEDVARIVRSKTEEEGRKWQAFIQQLGGVPLEEERIGVVPWTAGEQFRDENHGPWKSPRRQVRSRLL